ncbi:5798_t:CDS:2 [Paraglomus occultum]|uniref:5798_t:CDS:1 n=1 Tax=Paraglomus occultum TaxID=144539 RepID=A0A9N9B5Y7_9GLOM|nr:5798_t:CDS:2 [Paraglomus occultum]
MGGHIIWSQWARVIAIVAATFQVLGGVFGLFYRHSVFVSLPSVEKVVLNPVNFLAIICIITGFAVLVMEFFVKRYFVARAVLYILIAGVSVLNYQNTNPALYLLISAVMYIAAEFNSENVATGTNEKGKGNMSDDEKTATGTPDYV